MDTAQWAKGIGVVKSMEDGRPAVERKARPQKDQALNCPRCNSTNTKFCYYNNYSLSQPRYFCKACRRYWTEGGSLRNVPVGGGSRKNKRSSSSSMTVSTSSLSSSANKGIDDLNPPTNFLQSASQNPKIRQGQDLNLTYPSADDYTTVPKFIGVPLPNGDCKNPNSFANAPSSVSAMELFKSGIASRGLISFMPMPESDSNMFANGGFPMHEFKPTFNFSLDGFENGYGGFQNVQDTAAGAARHLFPIEDLKQVPSSATPEFQQTRELGDPAAYWNRVFGGGSW